MNISIRGKILLGAVILLFLTSLLMFVMYSLNRSYILNLLDTNQINEAKRGSEEIQNYFADINGETYDLLSKYKEDTKAVGTQSATLNDFLKIGAYTISKNDKMQKVTFLSPKGKEIYKIDNRGIFPQEKLNYEVPSETFTKALGGTTALSKVYYISDSLGPHVDIFTPVYDDKARIQGVVKIQVQLETLRNRLDSFTFGKNGYLYVVDQEGRLIAHPSAQYVMKRVTLTNRDIVGETLAGKSVSNEQSTYVNEQNVQVFAKAEKVPGLDWVVVAEEPVSDVVAFVNYLRDISFFILGGSFFFLFIISILLSEYLTRPIRKLRKTAEDIEKGSLNIIEPIKTGDEIESLSTSLSSMVNRLLLREHSAKMQNQEMITILQSMYDAVIALDKNGRIIAFNKSAEKLTGYKLDQVENKNVDDVVNLSFEGEKVQFQQYKKSDTLLMGKMREKGFLLQHATGKKMNVSLTTSPLVHDGSQSGYIIVFHDLTKEQQLEEMKIDFVSMAAHELRTPLTAIRGYASLLEIQKAKMLDDAGKELVQRLLISSNNLGNLIDNLLSVSRIERNNFSVEKRPVKLNELITNVVDTIKHQTTTKKQNLTMHIQSDLPITMADPFRITQVILNLVSNASNYTREGGHISIRATKNGNDVQVIVKDNGQGIPESALPKLFSKFFRVSGVLEQGSKGTGLGLYISKSIIEMHNGKIWATSTINKGSTFSFSLPIATEEEVKQFEEKVKQVSTFTKHAGGSIILKK